MPTHALIAPLLLVLVLPRAAYGLHNNGLANTKPPVGYNSCARPQPG